MYIALPLEQMTIKDNIRTMERPEGRLVSARRPSAVTGLA